MNHDEKERNDDDTTGAAINAALDELTRTYQLLADIRLPATKRFALSLAAAWREHLDRAIRETLDPRTRPMGLARLRRHVFFVGVVVRDELAALHEALVEEQERRRRARSGT